MRLIVFCLLLACGQASAQLILRLNNAEPATIGVSDLAKLPRHTAALTDHGKQIQYEGVLLRDVLARNGIDFGAGLRGKQLSSYVTAIGSDGYEVVYALADFDPSITDSAIILADRREGKLLGPNEGPLRVVVPQDKRAARSVRLLKEIDVVQLNK